MYIILYIVDIYTNLFEIGLSSLLLSPTLLAISISPVPISYSTWQ